MLKTLHIELTKSALIACDWPGGPSAWNRISVASTFPDEVGDIFTPKMGRHFLGWSFCALTHFCSPLRADGKTGFTGYSFKTDTSVPGLFAAAIDIGVTPEAWGELSDEMLARLPMRRLLSDLQRQINPDLRCIIFPHLGEMVDWVEDLISMTTSENSSYEVFVTSVGVQTRLEAFLGWIMHFVQDACVPYHAGCVLLKGHEKFEAALIELWRKSPKCRNYFTESLDNLPPAISLREITEQAALQSYALWSNKKFSSEAVLSHAKTSTARAILYVKKNYLSLHKEA